ncbi:putative ribonuclease H-like domain-containing protein [Rosa chinensis]|uniref:Putative ribonuclease H-like domain-containing protein n=2 Tax=Rosa chinensis TaxID=74649 RepID=A0A2P6RJ08_ROSCH|nr:putative ribonuclease H-like domain-containing protein [Rosa chinensis]
MQVSNIIIETDCLEAVSCIAETQFTYVHDEGIIDDIRQELNHRTDISVQHTSRVNNRVAHCLANLAFEARHSSMWFMKPPDFIVGVLNDDCKHLR